MTRNGRRKTSPSKRIRKSKCWMCDKKIPIKDRHDDNLCWECWIDKGNAKPDPLLEIRELVERACDEEQLPGS